MALTQVGIADRRRGRAASSSGSSARTTAWSSLRNALVARFGAVDAQLRQRHALLERAARAASARCCSDAAERLEALRAACQQADDGARARARRIPALPSAITSLRVAEDILADARARACRCRRVGGADLSTLNAELGAADAALAFARRAVQRGGAGVQRRGPAVSDAAASRRRSASTPPPVRCGSPSGLLDTPLPRWVARRYIESGSPIVALRRRSMRCQTILALRQCCRAAPLLARRCRPRRRTPGAAACDSLAATCANATAPTAARRRLAVPALAGLPAAVHRRSRCRRFKSGSAAGDRDAPARQGLQRRADRRSSPAYFAAPAR